LLIAKLPASQEQNLHAAFSRHVDERGKRASTPHPCARIGGGGSSPISCLQLASVSFDKQDETLVPEAGSCANCPKRTGFNKLLFAESVRTACIDPQCFVVQARRSHIEDARKASRKLVQISSAWSSREGAPLGRNHYLELQSRRLRPTEQRRSCRGPEALREDDGSHRDGRRQARQIVKSARPGLPRASPQHFCPRTACAGEGEDASASKKPSWQSPLYVGSLCLCCAV